MARLLAFPTADIPASEIETEIERLRSLRRSLVTAIGALSQQIRDAGAALQRRAKRRSRRG